MGQNCCCIGGTVDQDEREEAPRAPRRASLLAVRAAAEERACRGRAAAAERAARGVLAVEGARSGARAAAALALRQQRECEGAEVAARAALETAGGAALLELREQWERTRLVFTAANTWGQAGLAHLDLREEHGRTGVEFAQALAWGKAREGAAACRCTETASGSDRGRCSSSGRESDGATPEESSLGEGAAPGEAHPVWPPDNYEQVVTLAKKLGQLIPEQLIPEQLIPEQLIPEQLIPEQLIPEQLIPEQLIPEQGTFGLVFAGSVKDTAVGGVGAELPDKGVAVKIFATPEEDEERTQWALSAVTGLKHDNLVITYAHGTLPLEKGSAIFAEHSASGAPPAIESRVHFRWMLMGQAERSLHQYLLWKTRCKKERFGVKALATWARQTARGLAYLHRHGLCHPDLKVQNLLLAPSPKGPACQICDMDSVHKSGAACSIFTQRYLDPMVWASSTRTTSADRDVWSLGITAHYIFCQGSDPSGMTAAFEAAERGQFAQIRAHQGLPSDIRALLESCWQPAGQRCTADDFSAACNPRDLIKSVPEGSAAHENYLAVMSNPDKTFNHWLDGRQ